MATEEIKARITELVRQLRSIPRFDMTFQRVRPTFRLDSHQYKEVRVHSVK